MRRLRPYARIARAQLLTALSHPADIAAEVALYACVLVATGYLWRAAYDGAHGGAVEGVGRQQMITYAVVSVILASCFSTSVQWTVPERVRNGDIVIDLIRPVNPVLAWLWHDIGVAAGRLLVHVPLLLLLGLLCFRPSTPRTPLEALLFALSAFLGFLIVWCLSAIVALATFWTGALGNLGNLKDAVVRVFSGAVVPLWFLPVDVERIGAWLPFVLMFQQPLGIYIGKVTPAQAGSVLALQTAWLLAMAGALATLWTASRRRVHAQGG
jgi:ABC-2 type transport system permease protein